MIDTTPTNSITKYLEDRVQISPDKLISLEGNSHPTLNRLLNEENYEICYPSAAQIQQKKKIGFMFLAKEADAVCGIQLYHIIIYDPNKDEKVIEGKKPEGKLIAALNGLAGTHNKTYKSDAN